MVITMENSKKMQLSDLQQRQVDRINWDSLDSFFNVDASRLMVQPLILSKIIEQNQILQVQEINSGTVLNYLSGMAADVQKLNNVFSELKAKYVAGKATYVNNYNEDAHMFSLSISHGMVEWLEQYEDTVGKNLNDVIDYMNSVLPSNDKINL